MSVATVAKAAIFAVVLFNVACFLGGKAQALGTAAYWSDHAHACSDWLINYSSGFVRRGFAGEALRRLAGGGSAAGLMSYLSFGSAAALLAAFLTLVVLRWRRLGIAALALATLTPGAMSYLFVTEDLLFRKELFFHLLTLVNLFLFVAAARVDSVASRRTYFVAALATFSVAGGALALTHEAYLFMCAPINLLISTCLFAPQGGLRPALARASIIQCVPLAAALACMVFSGDAGIAQGIWDSLAESDRNLMNPGSPGVPMGGIAAIGYNVVHAAELTLLLVYSGQIMVWILLVPVTVMLTLWLGAEVALSSDRPSPDDAARRDRAWAGVVAVNAIVFAGVLPMYVIGWDYGRWTSCYAIGVTLLTLAAPEIFHRTLALLPAAASRALVTWTGRVGAALRALGTLGLAPVATAFAVAWLAFVRIDVVEDPISPTVRGIVPATLYRAAASGGLCDAPVRAVPMILCGRSYQLARQYNRAGKH